MVDRSDLRLSGYDEPVASASGNELRLPSPPPISHSRGERDALELHEIETHHDDAAGTSSASISSGEYRVTTRRTVSRTSQRTERSRAPCKGLLGKVQRFWTRNVVLTVPQKSNRDHFGEFIAFVYSSIRRDYMLSRGWTLLIAFCCFFFFLSYQIYF
jgi:hypothetical protein